MKHASLPQSVRLVLFALSLAFVALLATTGLFVAKAGVVCSDGRTSLEKVVSDYAALEQQGVAGRMWNRLLKAPGGGELFYVVMEKRNAAALYVFQDGCLMILRDTMDGDQMLRLVGKTTRNEAFPDGGI